MSGDVVFAVVVGGIDGGYTSPVVVCVCACTVNFGDSMTLNFEICLCSRLVLCCL